ncbi:cytochrome c oxidase assembly protein subunit 15 [Serinibacter salmoneus]|uniref:Cytochrome c oxidase assembly protein subunit 15 n=1 Tax=Serinibacter salmoneus TaxID=556530 RepID=A0A2A9CYE4_9MICO|nr:cytochrome c oxidase assembly protein subunit 15 [Serinibacter salmoneus]
MVLGFAIANLAAQIGIIFTGGVVRLTGSGLGCSTWPQCEPGSFTPVLHAESGLHPYIEFGNRLLTFVLVVVAAGLALSVWRSASTRTRPRSLKVLALAPILGVVVQAVLGGITVLVDLHPAVVGSHFFLSAALVWLSTVVLWRLREGDAPARATLTVPERWRTWMGALPWALGVLTAIVVVLGVLTTGSGPHSGDSEVGYRFALDPALIARFHAVSVWAFLAVVGVSLVPVMSRRSAAGAAAAAVPAALRARRAWIVLVVVTLAQGGIGYVQYFTGLPIPLVSLHLLGSGLLIAAVTAAVLSLRTREQVR